MKKLIDSLRSGLNSYGDTDGQAADSRRLFHGRGHCFPGYESICIDAHPPMILVSLFSPVDDEPGFTRFLQDAAGLISSSVFDSLAVHHRYEKPARMDFVIGEAPETAYATEGGLRYELNTSGNQNVGFFLDAAPARQWARENSAECKVLNLFSYTCSFSVTALAGGARRVVNVDMSRSAMRTGEKNHALNFGADRQRDAKFMAYEIFRSMGRLKKAGPFDLIIADPPSFQPGSFVAKSDYARLLKKVPALSREGTKLLLGLNAPSLPPDFLLDLAAEHCPEFTFQERLENSSDFPDTDPGRSLKMLVFSR